MELTWAYLDPPTIIAGCSGQLNRRYWGGRIRTYE
jgi:hypothetical protein